MKVKPVVPQCKILSLMNYSARVIRINNGKAGAGATYQQILTLLQGMQHLLSSRLRADKTAPPAPSSEKTVYTAPNKNHNIDFTVIPAAKQQADCRLSPRKTRQNGFCAEIASNRRQKAAKRVDTTELAFDHTKLFPRRCQSMQLLRPLSGSLCCP